MQWRWSEISALIDEAAAMTSTDVVERRVLSLVDPAYPENGTASTRNLNAGFQVLLPGERARPHRHSMNAIRFVVEAVARRRLSMESLPDEFRRPGSHAGVDVARPRA